MKTNYLEILFPDGEKVKLNLYDDYETKLKVVEDINQRWGNYFNENWDKTLIIAGSPQRPVPRLLDLLATYLLWGNEKELTDNNILNRYKTSNISYRELPLTDCATNLNDLFYSINPESENEEYTEQNYSLEFTKIYDKPNKSYSRFRHLQKIDDNFIDNIKFYNQSGLNKVREHNQMVVIKQIDNYYCLAIKAKFFNEKSADADKYKHQVTTDILKNYYTLKFNYKCKDRNIQQKNRLLEYAKKNYKNVLTQFDKIQLFKTNNIDLEIPYIAEWCTVNTENEFLLNGQIETISAHYPFDKVLVYRQGDKTWYLTPEIKIVYFFNDYKR